MATVENVEFFMSGQYCEGMIDMAYVSEEGEPLFTNITSDILVQDSLSIDRYSTSGDKVEIGGAYAAELKFKVRTDLANEYEKFNVDFIGNTSKVYAKRDDGTIADSIGTFITTDIDYNGPVMSVTALDRMITLEKKVDWDILLDRYEFYKSQYPLEDDGLKVGNTYAMIKAIADVNGMNVARSYSLCFCKNNTFDGYSSMTDLDITYRELLQNIAFLNAGNAYMGDSDDLCLTWYTTRIYNNDQINFELTSEDRYTSRVSNYDVTISGVKYTDETGAVYSAGTDEYPLSYSGCKIMDYVDKQTALNNINEIVGGFTYRPFEATMRRLPYIIPTCFIDFVDERKGETYRTIITHQNFKLNGSTKIAAVGKPSLVNEYTLLNKLTGATQQAISETESKLKEEMRAGMAWTLLKNTTSEEVIPDLDKYNEFMICCFRGDRNIGRVMASTIIPGDSFRGYNTDHGDGAHQAYYTSSIHSGVSHLGNGRVKMYHTSSEYAVLYGR